MDEQLRQTFYELLLIEQHENPRTFIISTNIFIETKSIFDEVKIINKSSIILEESYESLMSDYVIVTYKSDYEKPFKESLKDEKISYGTRALIKREHLINKKNIMIETPSLEYIFEMLTERGGE